MTRPVSRKAKATATLRERIPGPQMIQHTQAKRSGGTSDIIWQVKSTTTKDAKGAANNYKAYYTCERVKYSATKFNLGNSDPVAVVAEPTDEIVMNFNERGYSTEPELIVGDLLEGIAAVDDARTAIYIAIPVNQGPQRAETVEAAQTNGLIRVQLLTDGGAKTANGFWKNPP